MIAEVKLVVHFAHQGLGGVEPFVELARFGEERSKMGVEPFGIFWLVFGVEAFEVRLGFPKIALNLFVFALGLLANGRAVDDEQAPGAGSGRAFQFWRCWRFASLH